MNKFTSEDKSLRSDVAGRPTADDQNTMLEGALDEATVGLEAETSQIKVLEAPTEALPTVLPSGRPRTAPTMLGPEEVDMEAVTPSEGDVAPDPSVGDQIRDYDLIELLGKGGAGSVFKARRGRDGKIVALKVLAAKKLSRSRVVKRFIDEAKAAETVKHECLVRLLEFIEEKSPRQLAYAMEYVKGESLRACLNREKALHLTEAIHIARKMCHGVGALHAAGIIHRDLKPENIMVIASTKDGEHPQVKVLDFGVAKFLTGEADKKEGPGTFVGTPRYMAPEQAAGGKIDARSDLFAIGVMLFEMITGSRPHDGDTLKSVVMAKLKGAPRIKVNPGREVLPQELSDVVDSCLKLRPSERPNTTQELDRVLSSAYTVLSAVGPIRLVDDGAMVREYQPAQRSRSSRPSLADLDNEGEKISSYVIRGGASDDFRAKRTVKRAAALPPVVRRRPPQAMIFESDKNIPAKAQIAPRKKSRASIKSVAFVLASAILFGFGVYSFIDGGGFYDAYSVETAKPLRPPKPTLFSKPHDVLILSKPSDALLMIDGQVVGRTPHRVRIPNGIAGLGIMLLLEGHQREAIRLTRESGEERLVELQTVRASAKKPGSSFSPDETSEEAFFELEIDE